MNEMELYEMLVTEYDELTISEHVDRVEAILLDSDAYHIRGIDYDDTAIYISMNDDESAGTASSALRAAGYDATPDRMANIAIYI